MTRRRSENCRVAARASTLYGIVAMRRSKSAALKGNSVQGLPRPTDAWVAHTAGQAAETGAPAAIPCARRRRRPARGRRSRCRCACTTRRPTSRSSCASAARARAALRRPRRRADVRKIIRSTRCARRGRSRCGPPSSRPPPSTTRRAACTRSCSSATRRSPASGWRRATTRARRGRARWRRRSSASSSASRARSSASTSSSLRLTRWVAPSSRASTRRRASAPSRRRSSRRRRRASSRACCSRRRRFASRTSSRGWATSSLGCCGRRALGCRRRGGRGGRWCSGSSTALHTAGCAPPPPRSASRPSACSCRGSRRRRRPAPAARASNVDEASAAERLASLQSTKRALERRFAALASIVERAITAPAFADPRAATLVLPLLVTTAVASFACGLLGLIASRVGGLGGLIFSAGLIAALTNSALYYKKEIFEWAGASLPRRRPSADGLPDDINGISSSRLLPPGSLDSATSGLTADQLEVARAAQAQAARAAERRTVRRGQGARQVALGRAHTLCGRVPDEHRRRTAHRARGDAACAEQRSMRARGGGAPHL